MSNLATGPLCGTEWWCPVVANEHYLRWGVQLAVLAWALSYEWDHYQRTKPLIQLFQSKLAEYNNFQASIEDVLGLGILVAFHVFFQFVPSETPWVKWGFALALCIHMLWSRFFFSSKTPDPFCILFTDSEENLYRISCHSVDEPLYLTKFDTGNGYLHKTFATLNELVEFLGKPKSQ